MQEALDVLARKGSALVIAHRLSTIMDSEKIVVVGSAKDGENQGTVMESGTHEELLAKAIPGQAEAEEEDDDEEEEEDTDEDDEGSFSGQLLSFSLCSNTTEGNLETYTNGIYRTFTWRAQHAMMTKHVYMYALAGVGAEDEEQEQESSTSSVATNAFSPNPYKSKSVERDGPPQKATLKIPKKKQGGPTTYRRLWNAASGADEAGLSLEKMEAKATKLEGELALLKKKVQRKKARQQKKGSKSLASKER